MSTKFRVTVWETNIKTGKVKKYVAYENTRNNGVRIITGFKCSKGYEFWKCEIEEISILVEE